MPIPRTEPLPSGRWRGVATVDGRRTTRSFDTEGQALHWATVEVKRAQVAARRPAEPTPSQKNQPLVPTFRAMVETYLATCAVEPGTVLTYRSNLQPAVERWGGRALDAITYTDVVTWVADMNRLRGATRRAPSTMLARLKQVCSVFAEARRLGC